MQENVNEESMKNEARMHNESCAILDKMGTNKSLQEVIPDCEVQEKVPQDCTSYMKENETEKSMMIEARKLNVIVMGLMMVNEGTNQSLQEVNLDCKAQEKVQIVSKNV